MSRICNNYSTYRILFAIAVVYDVTINLKFKESVHENLL